MNHTINLLLICDSEISVSCLMIPMNVMKTKDYMEIHGDSVDEALCLVDSGVDMHLRHVSDSRWSVC